MDILTTDIAFISKSSFKFNGPMINEYIGERVTAAYDYFPISKKYLTLVNNEPLEIIEIVNEKGIVLCKNKDWKIGKVKIGNLNHHINFSILMHGSYHGNITKDTLFTSLLESPVGSYLIRDSSSVMNAVTLEFRCWCSYAVHKLQILCCGGHFLVFEHRFPSIDDLISNIKFHNRSGKPLLSISNPIIRMDSVKGVLIKKVLEKFGLLLNEFHYTKCDKIGEGEFGDVCYGIMKTKNFPVAIKSLHVDHLEKSSLFNETLIMLGIGHPNVVSFLGATMKNNSVASIVMEWCDKGSLFEYSKDINNATYKNILKIIIQVCDGFSYIHNRGIVHGDIAARNVLLTKNLVPKVCDFGMANFGSYKYKNTKVPKRWMAPESIKDQEFSFMSDVWSFGVLMWESFSGGEIPYKYIPIENLYDSITMLNFRLEQPLLCCQNIYEIMMKCWSDNPNDRISFDTMRTALVIL